MALAIPDSFIHAHHNFLSATQSLVACAQYYANPRDATTIVLELSSRGIPGS